MTRAANTVFAFLLYGAPVFAQDAGGLDMVGSEFLSVMKSAGWKDARYERIAGTEDLFEISGFSASSVVQGQKHSVTFGKLTVQDLRPDDRWTRADSVRLEDLRISRGGGILHVGMLYADQAGVLDVDTPRRSVQFNTVIVKDVSMQDGGAFVARASEAYASGTRWVGNYGIPGRLAVSAKVELSPQLLAAISGVPSGGGAVTGDITFLSALDTVRGAARASLDFKEVDAAATVRVALAEVGEPLFRSSNFSAETPAFRPGRKRVFSEF